MLRSIWTGGERKKSVVSMGAVGGRKATEYEVCQSFICDRLKLGQGILSIIN